MSGTSLDGVDAVLADFEGGKPRLIANVHLAFDAALKNELLALNSPGENEIERAALAGNQLAKKYADAVAQVLARSKMPTSEVRAIGCHGQTVRHRPERGYTTQLGNAALLAELSGLCVVADFRSRDVAAGGQGAPLVPAFHAAVFADAAEDRVVINLGGIANLTFLPRQGKVIGFDSGPGNCLLDLWATKHLGTPHDDGGSWAAGGQAIPALLERLLQEPYFATAPPKSTGRDLFNPAWLRANLRGGEDPQAVQATLVELTARSLANAIARHGAGAQRLIVCGGGVKNNALMRRLAELAAPAALETSARHGIDPQLVEATAFAWLAKQTLGAQPGNLPSVTGARGARILGTIHP
ncbi:MAG: anhydro-N-acetylmuramic acid kinase [Betaproteobacteria bacterium]|nr:anhydro-N-acetylmuramic acid kinase [Betaproteobacteria bacterium]MSQ89290.1 anhydro-N-acetylmuramic acid kinase [Betaproteobacteria bacterium]